MFDFKIQIMEIVYTLSTILRQLFSGTKPGFRILHNIFYTTLIQNDKDKELCNDRQENTCLKSVKQ